MITFKKYYKLIAIDLSKQQALQENEDLIQQINLIGRLEQAANVFIIIEKKENTILEFSQNFLMYRINYGKSKDNQFIKQKRY